MKKRINILLILVAIFCNNNINAQQERKFIRQGNSKYEKKNYPASEIDYRKALDKKVGSFEASFNLADALYKQGKYQDAATQFLSLTGIAPDKKQLAKVYHNLGNSLFQDKKIQESIEAYKQALINDPTDLDTKYNLSLALKMLKNGQGGQNNQKQDQKDNDKKDQQKQDQQQQKEQQAKEQQAKQQETQKDDKKISKEEAQKILQALENDEKDLQEKLREKRVSQREYKVLKDW